MSIRSIAMNLKHGGLENLILNVVWDNSEVAEEVLSVAQVQDCLNRLNTRKKWAYTTVKTILDRLTDKGLLQKVRAGKKYNYRAVLKREEMAHSAIKKLALEYFKNDFNALATFVNEIQKAEENSLIYVKN